MVEYCEEWLNRRIGFADAKTEAAESNTWTKLEWQDRAAIARELIECRKQRDRQKATIKRLRAQLALLRQEAEPRR